ncbi:MAG: hypothetical protein LRZ88_06375 [Candidatus Cloacimonetes bacterium]|nr:hypothetical protein [Candidatus Cloacimonadota bacterium]
MKDIIIKNFIDTVSDYLEALANRDGDHEEKAAYCADQIYRQSKGMKDVELIDSFGYSARRCGGVLAQYIDDATEEVAINMEMSEEALAIMLENAYPQIVAYETDKAYKDSSETFDIDYWIDDAVGEIAAKKVSDSEETPDA